MKPHVEINRTRSSVRLVALFVGVAGMLASAFADAAKPVVAVFSQTKNGYQRTLQADNTFKPETYAFADGGRLPGAFTDASIDNLKFRQVAGVVAAELRKQNYLPTTDTKTANLLIFVSFGTTIGVDENDYQQSMTGMGSAMSATARSPQGLGTSGLVNTQAISDDLTGFWGVDGVLDQVAMSNEARMWADRRNAGILGYQKAWDQTNVMRPYLATARDILTEIEESRYFVVLQAYDFQELRLHKQKKLLWETRYSIRRHGARFDEQLIDMTRYASQFCGQNVDRLIRRHLPEGHVEMGTPTVVPTSAK